MLLSERYHPIRFQLSRPFAKRLSTLMRGHTGLPSYELFQELVDVVYRTYNNEIMNLPFASRPDNLRGVNQESSLSMHYATFCSHGRQIFHFNNEITEQFLKTDIEGVTFNNIKLPYDVVYLSFGKQQSLDLWGSGNYVDGAYVSWYPSPEPNMEILLTTISANYDGKSDRFDWISNPSQYYYLALPTDDLSTKISNAAEIALKEDLTVEKKAKDQSTSIEVEGYKIKNKRPESAALHIDELQSGFPVFREALRLIINGICYLSAYPDDLEKKWSEDTPISMLKKLKNSNKPKIIRNTKSKLTSMGYTKIQYCGRALKQKVYLDTNKNKKVAPHWRRGHWRNQACGRQLADNRLIWIMPTIVRKSEVTNKDIQGHIYTISS